MKHEDFLARYVLARASFKPQFDPVTSLDDAEAAWRRIENLRQINIRRTTEPCIICLSVRGECYECEKKRKAAHALRVANLLGQ